MRFQQLMIINNKGVALLYVVMLLMFIGVAIGAVALLTGPLAKKSKTIEARNVIDSAIRSVIGYAAANRRLPTTTDFTNVASKTNDAWGNPLYYIVDGNLAPSSPALSSDYICGRDSTAITVRNCRNAGCSAGNFSDTPNVAFIVLSKGANFNNQTAATQSVTVATTINVYDAGLVIDNYAADLPEGQRDEPYDDIVKWVTLEELKSKAGCYGATPGRFIILNNELPDACIGLPYDATLYADGGVAPYGNWTQSGLPGDLAMNLSSGAISGSTSAAAGPYDITFTRSDSDGNVTRKILRLTVKNCGVASGPLGHWNFDDPSDPGGTQTGTGTIAPIAGVFGGALQFLGNATLTPSDQGGGGYPKFNFNRDSVFSIVLWVKLTKFPTEAPTSFVYPLVSKGGPNWADIGYYLELHSSAYNPPNTTVPPRHRIAFRMVGQPAGPNTRRIHVYNSTDISQINTWYHVAVSYPGDRQAGNIRIYVQGASGKTIYEDNLLNREITNTQPLRIGDYGMGYYNSVIMDEVQIYDEAVWQLRLLKAGTGSGTVTGPPPPGSPERINCGGICEAYYVTGTSVTLTATANPGSTFAGWSGGGCAGMGTCTVALSNDTNVTATFTSP